MYRYKRFVVLTVFFASIMFISISSNIAFSAMVTGELEMHNLINGNKDNPSDQNIAKDGGVELEGMIGDWDPREGGLSKKLNDLNDTEITGVRAKEGEYFTIAATVPINMEFGVYPNSTNVVMGYFYSPQYRITNNGSKTLDVKIGFEKGKESDPEKTLFIDKPTRYNGKVEIDLCLSYTQKGIEKRVDLTEDLSDKINWKYMGGLTSNEEAIVTFKADSWEPIEWEATVRNSVESSGRLIFEFSY